MGKTKYAGIYDPNARSVALELLTMVSTVLDGGCSNYLWAAVGLFGERDEIEWEFAKNPRNEAAKKIKDWGKLREATIRSESSLAKNIIAMFQDPKQANLPYIWTGQHTIPRSQSCQLSIGVRKLFPQDKHDDYFAANEIYFFDGHVGVIIPLVLRSGGAPRLVGSIVLAWKPGEKTDKINKPLLPLLPLIKSHAIALLEPHRNLYGISRVASKNVTNLMLRQWLYTHNPYLFQGNQHTVETEERLFDVSEILQRVDGGGWLAPDSVAKSLYCCFGEKGKATSKELLANKFRTNNYPIPGNKFIKLWAQFEPESYKLLKVGKFDICLPSRPGILGFLSLLEIYKALSGNLEQLENKLKTDYIQRIVVTCCDKEQRYSCTFCYRYDITLPKGGKLDVFKLRARWWSHILGTDMGGAVVQHLWDASRLYFPEYEEGFLSDVKAKNPLFKDFFKGLPHPCFDIDFAPNQVIVSWKCPN